VWNFGDDINSPTLGQQQSDLIAKPDRYISPRIRPKQNIEPIGPLTDLRDNVPLIVARFEF
jgi:hypothetical protein